MISRPTFETKTKTTLFSKLCREVSFKNKNLKHRLNQLTHPANNSEKQQ